MKTETKFNKHNVALLIWQQINIMEETFKFKSYEGWKQVEGKGEEIAREYGKYISLLELTNIFDLPYTKN